MVTLLDGKDFWRPGAHRTPQAHQRNHDSQCYECKRNRHREGRSLFFSYDDRLDSVHTVWILPLLTLPTQSPGSQLPFMPLS